MKIKTILAIGEEQEWDAPSGATLLDYLREHGVWVNSSCGGNGSCHKCRVQVKSGFVGISNADRLAFPASALVDGWRLSCQVRPRTNVTVKVPLVENSQRQVRLLVNSERKVQAPLLVCDLGSTGVVVAMIDKSTGEILIEAHVLNRQIKYGADVMTRLRVAQEAAGFTILHEETRRTLELALQALCKNSRSEVEQALQDPIYIAGNSAMVSLLMNWDIQGLAVSPYQPIEFRRTRKSLHVELEKSGSCEIKVESLGLLGGFVGADTMAGIFLLESRMTPKPWMLVDIGTNTEMVIAGEDGSYWYTSAPAGPAFEGGNITKGMRAEPGAISSAKWKIAAGAGAGSWSIETIRDDVPIGICGSGLIDIFAESIKAGLLSSDGMIEDRIHLTDEIDVFADDVREFQLAKSATRTGIDILQARANIQPGTIYLAGTFAQHLNLANVVSLGLLPGRVPIVKLGNASLLGTAEFARTSEAERSAFESKVNLGKRQIELALEDDFQDRFVKNLNF